MRVLPYISPTPEQTKIISRSRPGTEIIRGSAGSGKTTTALLRLRSLIASHGNRLDRLGEQRNLSILVLTFNTTLRGYIEELSQHQTRRRQNVDLEISTFAKWSMETLNWPNIVEDPVRTNKILELSREDPLNSDFLEGEIEYCLGKCPPGCLEQYISMERTGRGATPRVDKEARRRILNNIVYPYQKWKTEQDLWDWNDLANAMQSTESGKKYDIIIVDEAQDFSANQIRAITRFLHETYSLTVVLDATQRIYPRGFTWQEVGVNVRPQQVHTLEVNYRNTQRIAEFAIGFVRGLPSDPDAAIPDPMKCSRVGEYPKIVKGRFSDQISYAIDFIKQQVNLKNESVAFLQPKGGAWFAKTRKELRQAGLNFVNLTRKSEWPQDQTNIALSTLHSAKGLEFDNVFILGLSMENLPYGDGEEDDRLLTSRRLVAMGVTRARNSVVLGYKPAEASALVKYAEQGTFEEIEL